MKHRGRIHFAMVLSSFEMFRALLLRNLEHFTAGLHWQVEFGCHGCHERMEDAYLADVARLRMMMPRRPKKRKTRQGSTCQDDRGRFNQFFSGHNIRIHKVFSPFSVQEDWEKTDMSYGNWVGSPKKTCTATLAKDK